LAGSPASKGDINLIPDLDSFLEMYRKGYMPLWQICEIMVRIVATEGTSSDFYQLPSATQDEIIAFIDQYRFAGGLRVFTSGGGWDVAPFAEAFILKTGYPDLLPRPPGGRAFWGACLRFRRECIPINTVRDHLQRRYRLACWCPRCKRFFDRSLERLVMRGKGDEPLLEVRILHRCGSRAEICRIPPCEGWLIAPPMPLTAPAPPPAQGP
jgi:hypothetical protein